MCQRQWIGCRPVTHFQQPARQTRFNWMQRIAGRRLLHLKYGGLGIANKDFPQGSALIQSGSHPPDINPRHLATELNHAPAVSQDVPHARERAKRTFLSDGGGLDVLPSVKTVSRERTLVSGK